MPVHSELVHSTDIPRVPGAEHHPPPLRRMKQGSGVQLTSGAAVSNARR